MLPPIYYSSTDDKPEVTFDVELNRFEIIGRSMPENANTFYEPLEKWLSEYALNPNDFTELVFRLDYFNSASSTKLVKLMICLESIVNKDERVKVSWFYHQEDDLLKMRGEELKSIIELPFELIEFV